jgi:hypothetical protein
MKRTLLFLSLCLTSASLATPLSQEQLTKELKAFNHSAEKTQKYGKGALGYLEKKLDEIKDMTKKVTFPKTSRTDPASQAWIPYLSDEARISLETSYDTVLHALVYFNNFDIKSKDASTREKEKMFYLLDSLGVYADFVSQNREENKDEFDVEFDMEHLVNTTLSSLKKRVNKHHSKEKLATHFYLAMRRLSMARYISHTLGQEYFEQKEEYTKKLKTYDTQNHQYLKEKIINEFDLKKEESFVKRIEDYFIDKNYNLSGNVFVEKIKEKVDEKNFDIIKAYWNFQKNKVENDRRNNDFPFISYRPSNTVQYVPKEIILSLKKEMTSYLNQIFIPHYEDVKPFYDYLSNNYNYGDQIQLGFTEDYNNDRDTVYFDFLKEQKTSMNYNFLKYIKKIPQTIFFNLRKKLTFPEIIFKSNDVRELIMYCKDTQNYDQTFLDLYKIYNLSYLNVVNYGDSHFPKTLADALASKNNFTNLLLTNHTLSDDDTDNGYGLHSLRLIFGDRLTASEGPIKVIKIEENEVYEELDDAPISINRDFLKQATLPDLPFIEAWDGPTMLKNLETLLQSINISNKEESATYFPTALVLDTSEEVGQEALAKEKLFPKLRVFIKSLYNMPLSDEEKQFQPWMMYEENIPAMKKIFTLLFDSVKDKNPEDRVPFFVQLFIGLSKCPTGQAEAVDQLVQSLFFGNTKAVYTFDEKAIKNWLANLKANLFRDAFFLKNNTQNVHILAKYKNILQDDLGLVDHLNYEERMGSMGIDPWGTYKGNALKNFFTTLTPTKLIQEFIKAFPPQELMENQQKKKEIEEKIRKSRTPENLSALENIQKKINDYNKNPSHIFDYKALINYLVESKKLEQDFKDEEYTIPTLKNWENYFTQDPYAENGVYTLTEEGAKRILISFGVLKENTSSNSE